jgi:hypothetical protein
MNGYDEDVGAAIGLKERELTKVMNRDLAREGFAVLSVPNKEGGVRGSGKITRDVEVVTLDTKICRNKEYETPLEGYKQESGQSEPFSAYNVEMEGETYEPYLISFYPRDRDCESDSDSSDSDSDTQTVGSP